MRATSVFVIPLLVFSALATAGPETGLQAVQTLAAIRVDGHLDEAGWMMRATPASGFT